MDNNRKKKLIGKWALVTGGSRGIGRAICIELAKEGANVIVNYVSDEKAAASTVDEVKKYGVEVYSVKADISDRGRVQKMVDKIVTNDPIDILVNNAGIAEFSLFLEMTPEHWNKIINTNLYGTFNVGQIVAREMVKRKKGGKIVMVTSINQDVPNLQQGVYSIAKSGMKMLGRVMALELGEHNITVNSIASGAVPTDINKLQIRKFPGCIERYSNLVPLGRWGKPEEIAHTAVFLSTSPDSDYITGSTIYVEGGIMINNCWAQNKMD